ncbi:MAG TPA: hypothetical protein VK395_34680 [Gemmataceae bacterium]|nr:hypothetical protein [Gemmataceae bacterium]
MPRTARQTPGGYVYHTLNRATARLKLFRKGADYDAFLGLLDEALASRLAGGEIALRRLHPGPVVLPANWLQLVNKPQTEAEVEAMRLSVARGRPYGSDGSVQTVVKRLGLQSTIRSRGRPRKRPGDAGKGE